MNPPADFAIPRQQLLTFPEFIFNSFCIDFNPIHSFIKIPDLSYCKIVFIGFDTTCSIHSDFSFLKPYSVIFTNIFFLENPKKDAHLLRDRFSIMYF